MALIRELREDALGRAAWSMAYFGRTLFYNGPRTSPEARSFLRTPESFASRESLGAQLQSGQDPIDALLLRFLAHAYLDLSPADQERRRAAWPYKEATLNARARLAMALLEPEALGTLWRRLLPELPAGLALRLAEIKKSDDDKPRFGTPDVLVKGPSAVLLVEMKTRGVPSRHLYDPEQLVKYLNLAHDERLSWAAGEEREVVHVLLRPVAGGPICWRRVDWFDAPADGGRVRLDRVAPPEIAGRIKWKPAHDHERSLAEVGTLPVFERRYDELLAALPEATSLEMVLAKKQLEMVVLHAEPRLESGAAKSLPADEGTDANVLDSP